MSKDYTKMSELILKKVGGVDNVESVMHCMTRLRFIIKNDSKVNLDSLKQIEGVIDVIIAGGQYQVVIGTHVTEVYKVLITNHSELNNGNDVVETDKEKKSIFSKLIDTIAGIFLPLMPAMGAVGILKGLLVALSSAGWITTENDTYRIFYALADAFFYYLPLALAYTSAKKFKTNRFVAIAIVGAMIYPQIIPAFGTKLELSLFGIIPVKIIDYTNTVIPAIIVVYLLSKVEKLLERIIPEIIKMIFVPLISIIVVFPLSLIVVGPITSEAGNMLASAFLWVYNLNPTIAGGLLGLVWPVTIIFGLHWGFLPVTMNNIATLGYDPISPLTIASNFATAGAVFAVFLKTKNSKLKELSGGAAFSALIGGITEPGVYGVTLKYKKPFYIGCLFAGIGGIIVSFGAAQYPSVFSVCAVTLPSIALLPGGVFMLAAAIVGFVGTAIATYLFGFNDNMIKEN